MLIRLKTSFEVSTTSQTHFGFITIGSIVHNLSANIFSFLKFPNGTPCIVFHTLFFISSRVCGLSLLMIVCPKYCLERIEIHTTLLDQSVWNSKHSWKRKNKQNSEHVSQNFILLPPIFCIKIRKITLKGGPKWKKELTHN